MSRCIVILTQGQTEPLAAKTATCVIRYRTDEVVAILDTTQAGKTSHELLGVGGNIPVVASLDEAPGADTLLIGIAPAGGKIPADWRQLMIDAIGRGLSIVSGLHDFLSEDAELADAARARGVQIVDVRKNAEHEVAHRKGIRSECLRIQTVGVDCSVGKMVTAIETQRALVRQGFDAKFVATGQTGIMVEGDGCPIDCVVADFINGAAERLVLANQDHDILVIEGQGSLCHPRYSPVTLGLLHGCMPDGLILCYEVGRTMVRRMEHLPLPSLNEQRRLFETMASVMHPCRVIGIGMNSQYVTPEQAEKERERMEAEMGLPVCDVIRHGPETLVSAVLEQKEELGK